MKVEGRRKREFRKVGGRKEGQVPFLTTHFPHLS